MSMKKIAWLGAVVLTLAGCSSVSLDSAQVEDRSTGGPATASATHAATGGDSVVAKTTASQTDAVKPAQDAIASVARLVYFDYDSYVIKPEFQALIDAHARYLKGDGKRKVAIEGHTDERGGREYNLALGQRRAEAVRRSLVLLGVDDSQIEAVSFGKEKPAAQGNDEAAWSKNRRAEISYR